MGLSTLHILGSVWQFSGVNARGSFLALSTHPLNKTQNLWVFDVEISERSTSKSPSVRRWTLFESSERSTSNAFWKLRAFDVERFLKSPSVRRWTLFESSERSTSNAFWKLRAFDVVISERSTSNAFWKLCVRTFDSDCFQIFEISELSNLRMLQNRWRRLDNED